MLRQGGVAQRRGHFDSQRRGRSAQVFSSSASRKLPPQSLSPSRWARTSELDPARPQIHFPQTKKEKRRLNNTKKTQKKKKKTKKKKNSCANFDFRSSRPRER